MLFSVSHYMLFFVAAAVSATALYPVRNLYSSVRTSHKKRGTRLVAALCNKAGKVWRKH